MRRFQLDMEEKQFKLLKKLKDQLDAGSNAEVMRRALKAYDSVLNRPVYVKGDDGEFIPLDVVS